MSIELPVKVYVGLGSNCTDAEAVLGRARDGIAALPKLRLTAVSPVYSTEPQEFTDQPWFLNQGRGAFACAVLATPGLA